MRRFVFVVALLLMMVSIIPMASAQNQTIHVVQRGENLFRIALRYNTSMAAIAQANNISNFNLVFVGQQLVIPAAGAPVGTPVPTTPRPGTAVPSTAVPPATGSYTVVRGDTLNSIARRFNTTAAAISQANGITNPNRIFVGQVLRISGAPAPGAAATPRPGGGAAPTPPPATGPIPGGFELGGHIFSFSYPDQMRGAGMTWAKSQIVWNQGDPASIAQGAIDAAKSRGFKILLGVVGNPAQLAANPTQYYQNFATFLADVARLNPDAIEVWNEPNIERQWPAGQINGTAYTAMLSASFQAIKRANPNVLVISGAPAPTGFFGNRCAAGGCDDNVFIQQMAQAGAAQFMDCVGIHYNEGVLPPSATSGDPRGSSGHYSRYYTSMVNLYAGTFPNKPLCFTELGYVTPEGYGSLPAGFDWGNGNTLQEQAEWLAQAVTLARASNRVRLMIIWNVDSTTTGADPQAAFAIVRGNQCLACITLGAAMARR
jgi:LysM repeat protein